MKSYIQKISDYLEGEWEIESKDTTQLEWWADEIWKLKSIWSPQGSVAYLIFLVDPMCKEKKDIIWGLGCCKKYPQSRMEAESGAVIKFGKSFKNQFLEFQLQLDSLREK